MLSYTEQCEVFDQLRDDIDRELRSTGFEDFLTDNGIEVSRGRLVVARFAVYASQLATQEIDLDPLSPRIATQYEVGVMIEGNGSRYYRGVPVGEALDGQRHEPCGIGSGLDYIQHISVLSSIATLRTAKAQGPLYSLTKSLKKIDPAGD